MGTSQVDVSGIIESRDQVIADAGKAFAAMSKHLSGARLYGEAEIQAIKAAAWFEGWDAGDSDAAKQQHSLASSGKALTDDEMSDNPYV